MTSHFQTIFDHTIDLLPQLASRNTSPIHGWLQAGCDIEADILPTITRLARRNPGAFSYFTPAILKAKEERERCLQVKAKIAADPDGEMLRKAKMAARTVRVFGIRSNECIRFLAEYEKQHGRVKL